MVRRGRIERVVRTADCPTTSARRFGTLLPGLVDPHVHLSFDAGERLEPPRSPDAMERLVERACDRMRKLARVGVTMVRDLGAPAGVCRRLDEESSSSSSSLPRFLGSSQPLTVPGGHLASFGSPVTSAREAREAVRRCVADGAKVVKVIMTGGRLTPGTEMGQACLSTELAVGIVDAAHDAGRPVAAHVHGTEGIRVAVAAGVDTLEHCSWTDRTGRVRRPVAGLIAEIRQRGQVIVTAGPLPPTLAHSSHGEFGVDRRGRRQVQLWKNARGAADRGAAVAIGTDSFFGTFPDASDLVQRAILMNRLAGWPSLDVLEAMTGTAARACAEPGRGELREGWSADLIGVAGDPIDDISALREVRLVLRDGQVVHDAVSACA